MGDQAEQGDHEKWEAMGVAPDREAIDGIMFVLEEPQEDPRLGLNGAKT